MGLWFRILAWLLVLLGVPTLLLYAFVFDVWVVAKDDPLLAAAIEPTLSAGEIVVVTRHTTVGRAELLRCADPQAPGRFVVARAMSKFGEAIEVRDDVVFVDGKHNPSPHACDSPSVSVHDPRSDEEVTLACVAEEYGGMSYSVLRATAHPEPPTHALTEPGKWYLISDDRHVHLDSRDFGQIDPATCQHIVFRLWGARGFGDADKRFCIIW